MQKLSRFTLFLRVKFGLKVLLRVKDLTFRNSALKWNLYPTVWTAWVDKLGLAFVITITNNVTKCVLHLPKRDLQSASLIVCRGPLYRSTNQSIFINFIAELNYQQIFVPWKKLQGQISLLAKFKLLSKMGQPTPYLPGLLLLLLVHCFIIVP